MCAELAVAALQRRDGNGIVFLPGLQEILRTQKRVKLVASAAQTPLKYHCEKLHSDLLGDADDEDAQPPLGDMADSFPLVVLASSVAARAVTLPSMKNVSVHP